VVRIIDRLNIGGPAKHVAWLTAGLDQTRFDSTLITGTVPESEGDMSYFARDMGIRPLIVREMSRELGLCDVVVIWKLLRHLFRIRPDLVHTHKSKAGAAGRLAAFIYRWATWSVLWLKPRPCKVVHTFHGHIFYGYYPVARTRLFIWIERILAWLCTDQIVVLSAAQRTEIRDRYNIGSPARFSVVPLGIDLDEIEEQPCALRQELKIDERDLMIGIVGRLCAVKNHALLLEAAAILLRDRDPGAQRISFVIVGDGELREKLEVLALRLGIQDSVRFLGFRKDAAAIYSNFDLVALTSTNEGTPLTLIEAMAAGRPVVATEAGGVVDILGDRLERIGVVSVWEHGTTSSHQDPASFAAALSYLIDHPERGRQMGYQGRLYVRSRLSRTRLVNDIERLYDQLLRPEQAVSEAPTASIET
jgi:glycosyltransferase involved in cell wall biosynthesis